MYHIWPSYRAELLLQINCTTCVLFHRQVCKLDLVCLQLFSKAGDISRIIMGLDKFQKTPCGFCFVVYHDRAGAERAVAYVNAMFLDGQQLRVDFDWGFVEGRQFGRGRAGGQVTPQL